MCVEIVLWAFGGIGASAVAFLMAKLLEERKYSTTPVASGISFRTRDDFGPPAVTPLSTFVPLPSPQEESFLLPASSSVNYDGLLDMVLTDANPPISIESTVPRAKTDAAVYKFFEQPDFNASFQFNIAETNVSKWEDGTVALTDQSKMLYGDPNSGLLVASIQDPMRWKTKITKKPGKIVVEYTDEYYDK